MLSNTARLEIKTQLCMRHLLWRHKIFQCAGGGGGGLEKGKAIILTVRKEKKHERMT